MTVRELIAKLLEFSMDTGVEVDIELAAPERVETDTIIREILSVEDRAGWAIISIK